MGEVVLVLLPSLFDPLLRLDRQRFAWTDKLFLLLPAAETAVRGRKRRYTASTGGFCAALGHPAGRGRRPDVLGPPPRLRLRGVDHELDGHGGVGGRGHCHGGRV